MLPGPTLILACPFTGKPVFHHTWMSGNTFGSTCWTDGKMLSLMMEEELLFIRSPHSDGCFWTDEAKVLGEENEWEKSQGHWPEGEDELKPVESDYFSYLKANQTLSEEKIMQLRLQCWWAANDPYREESPPLWSRTEEQRSNMLALESLLSPEFEASHLSKAEIFRQLELFTKALDALSIPVSEELQPIALYLKQLISNQDSQLREFDPIN